MDRRAFLGALASGAAAALAGCMGQRKTLRRVTADPTLPAGEFYHEPLRLESGTQLNLHYEVTADGAFDVFLFGGQSDPAEFSVYQRAVGDAPDGAEDGGSRGDGRSSGTTGDRRRGEEDGQRRAGGQGGDGRPEPSAWHSIEGVRGRGEMNRPLATGTHHFVVDNTHVGAATPDGTLRPEITLEVRDFELPGG